jgi:hypothetical protein
MAEEIINNQINLTARQVAEQNPELNKLREIAFGENYLDDIDAGTGTARFYSGFGQQPTYTGTNTDQSVADAVTAQAEAVAAPDQSGGQDQVTGGLGLDTTFQDAGATDVPGTIGTLGDLTTPTTVGPFDYTDAPVTVPGLDLSGTSTDLIDRGVIETPQEFYERTYRTSTGSSSAPEGIGPEFTADYDSLDQEEKNLVDQEYGIAYGLSPAIEPATDFNLLGTAANLITGGITDIPLVGTAVQKATDFFKGGGNDSVASETDFSTMGDSSVDAFENNPNNIENIQTPLETAIGINSIDIPEIRGDDETISEDTVTETTDPIDDFEVSGGVGKPGEVLDTFLGPVASTPTETYYDGGSETDTSAGVDAGTADVQDYADTYDPSDSGGGGGSSGGGKIVCTMMNETYGFGSFRNKIWQKYAKDNLTREHEKGYHKIFLPLVRLSKTNIIVRKILEHIAVHRTMDIRQEARGKRHILGRVYRKVLEPICYLVGKYGKR